jgi:hypothetical protein
MEMQSRGARYIPTETIHETILFPIEEKLLKEKIKAAWEYGQQFRIDICCLLFDENEWTNDTKLTAFTLIKNILGKEIFVSIKEMLKNEEMPKDKEMLKDEEILKDEEMLRDEVIPKNKKMLILTISYK